MAKEIIALFAGGILSDDRDERVKHNVRYDFLRKLAPFVLSCPEGEIEGYLKPFLDGFKASEGIADLLKEIIYAEDRLYAVDNFWKVWILFKDKVIRMCAKGDNVRYVNQVLRSYLFADSHWIDEADSWHTLADVNKRFFKEMALKTGHLPSSLYAFSRLLNGVGSLYLNDGITWISDMLETNPDLQNAELVNNTVYYLENILRKYIYNNRETVRRERGKKNNVLVILDFLTEKGSVVGYMLRESIL